MLSSSHPLLASFIGYCYFINSQQAHLQANINQYDSLSTGTLLEVTAYQMVGVLLSFLNVSPFNLLYDLAIADYQYSSEAIL